jgi:hypothetical protein
LNSQVFDLLKKLYEKEHGALAAPTLPASARATKVEPKKETVAPAKPVTKADEKKQTAPAAAAQKKAVDEYEDDGWNDDAWGDADFGEIDAKKKPDPKKEPAKADKKGKEDLEDKFNKVMATSKEGGGLLASIGLKNKDIANEDASLEGDSEEAPHNKSDLFDTFDLGFNSNKKPASDKKEAAKDPNKAKT